MIMKNYATQENGSIGFAGDLRKVPANQKTVYAGQNNSSKADKKAHPVFKGTELPTGGN